MIKLPDCRASIDRCGKLIVHLRQVTDFRSRQIRLAEQGEKASMEEKAKTGGYEVDEMPELAGLSTRLLAGVMDGILQVIALVLAVMLVGLVWGDSAEFLLQFAALTVPIGYNWYFWTRRNGQTPGKFALGIQVVKADGSPISDIDAVIRAIGYQVSSLACGLGYIWAIFDKNNQTWHDKLARTYVVRRQGERHTVQV